MVIVERLLGTTELGEGPHWDVTTQCLYYVDIFSKSIHKYDPVTKLHTEAVLDKSPSFIIPIEGEKNKFLISQERDIVVITWDGVSNKISDLKKLVEVDTNPDVLGNRINDAKCDASGRLWAGTMGAEEVKGHIKPEMGTLYSFDTKRGLKGHVKGIGCSNGLSWSLDNTKMYYIDTFQRAIHQYDFDLESGNISNKQVIFSLDEMKIDGYPDGQTIDADGNIWFAIFGGQKVIQIDPRKKNTIIQIIEIPAKQVTSVAFGGKNLDELFITTACFEIDGAVLPPPQHGALYRVTNLGVKGLKAVNAKIN
ncbi:regucalcin-like [Onthophagus taurus]|uniref:regucalcin-like n=1 Tax=Onthophagus taurus TaxID=166361 RepID=UPI0039BDEB25